MHNILLSQVDPERIKLVGPDRACAEWLVRNGAAVQFHNQVNLVKNYDIIVGFKNDDRPILEVIDATGSAISHHGFANFSKQLTSQQ